MKFRQRFIRRFMRQRDKLRHKLLDRIDRFGGTGPSAQAQTRAPTHDRSARTGIAIVGCGFVADFYAATLPLHPELHLVGVTNRDSARAARFVSRNGGTHYPSLNVLLDDPAVELVVNLTNPSSHYEVSKIGLEAGKHVYSEKPLAMNMEDARSLVALAEAKGLLLSSAPCSVLGESAEAIREAIRRQEVGNVRLVYAELATGQSTKCIQRSGRAHRERLGHGETSSRSAVRWSTQAII